MDNNDMFRNEDNTINHEGDDLENIVVRNPRAKKFANAAKEVYSEMFGGVGNYLKETAVTFGRGMSIPLGIATAVRKGKDKEPIWGNENNPDSRNGLMTGYMLTIAGWMVGAYIAIGYSTNASYQNEPVHWEYYMIPVATNLIDGFIYEPLRKAWIKSR